MGIFGGKKDNKVKKITDYRTREFVSNDCLFEIFSKVDKRELEATLQVCKLFRNVKEITLSAKPSAFVALVEYHDLKVKSGIEVDHELKRLYKEAGIEIGYCKER